MREPMRVLAVASEIYPIIKTGGLADVAGALPLALRAEGVEMRTLVPGYPAVMDALERISSPPWLALDTASQRSCLSRAIAEGLTGGALYDALIAATAREHGARLLSADRRAWPAYEAMGVSVSYVE